LQGVLKSKKLNLDLLTGFLEQIVGRFSITKKKNYNEFLNTQLTSPRTSQS
jgi:hypothetical protein